MKTAVKIARSRRCATCGKGFRKGPHWKKYCSSRCRLDAYWMRRLAKKVT